MNRQVKNECQLEFPLFSPSNENSSLYINSIGRNAFRKYFLNHRRDILKIFSSKIADYVFFDLQSLSSKVNMDCLHCYKNCCGGKIRVATLKEYNQIYNDKYDDIVKSIPECYHDEFDSFVSQHGMFIKHPHHAEFLNTQAKDNHCVFLFRDNEGLNKCVIHKYCLDNNISPNLFKPGSCSLFPIDIIKFKMYEESGYFIFCSLFSTSSFSRFSVYDSCNGNTIYPCLDLSVANKRGFAEDTIMPAYVCASSYVKEVFDLDCISLIENSGMLEKVSKIHRLFNPNK